MLLGVTFAALLLCGVSAVMVPPPSNVTVSCQNLKTTVSWKYSSEQPETRFKVQVNGPAGSYTSETTDHQYDLSHFVWKSEDQYMDFHYVNVTAEQGGKKSKTVNSLTFSFNDIKTVSVKCRLDFPPVDLTGNEAVATLSFPNPFHFYKELEQASKPEDVSLNFRISTDNGTFDTFCRMKDITCKYDVSFPKGVEQCVTLTGQLCDSTCIGRVLFNKTGRICVRPSYNVHVIALSLMLGIFVFVVIVATVAICRDKVWTMNTYVPLPSSLIWDKPSQRIEEKPNGETEPIILVSVTPQSPPGSSEDDDYPSRDPGGDDNSSSSSGLQYYDKFYEDGELLEGSNQELESRGHGTDEDSTNDSVKTESVSIDLEEKDDDDENREGKPVSSYDSPKNLQDIGKGDMVIFYK